VPRGTILAMPERFRRAEQRGASPAQVILALLILGVVALVAVLAVRRVGL
jgi:hypothetical protein